MGSGSAMIEFIDLKRQYRELKASIDARIQRVLDHGRFIMGPEVGELEARLAQYTGAAQCVTVASGTEALLIALMAIGVGPGDEVVTTPFTFVATVEVVALLGATPVLVDIEPDTCNIDARRIEAAITPRTKAIIPVSLYGQVADMDEINAIARRHGVTVIEDAAQSLGASYKGRKSGHLSRIGCTSFFPSKPLGCYGDGGAIFTDEAELATAMREIRVHGQSERYHHTRIGVGGRMDTIQCAVLLAKLERFDWEIERRLVIGARYVERLAGIDGVSTLAVRPDRDCVWGQFTIFAQARDALVASLRNAGVPTAIHYPSPMHHQPAYASLCLAVGDLGASEVAGMRVVSLPMHPYLDERTQDRIVEAVRAGSRE